MNKINVETQVLFCFLLVAFSDGGWLIVPRLLLDHVALFVSIAGNRHMGYNCFQACIRTPLSVDSESCVPPSPTRRLAAPVVPASGLGDLPYGGDTRYVRSVALCV